MEGDLVGLRVGVEEGENVGCLEGAKVGRSSVGSLLGLIVGELILTTGESDGSLVGFFDGLLVIGESEGRVVGLKLSTGLLVGMVGSWEGEEVGTISGL